MTDPNFLIESPRLFLSYLQPTSDRDCDFLVALYNTPEFIASIGGNPTPVTDREAARTRLAGRFPAEHARNGYGTFLISLKLDSDDESDSNATRISTANPIGTVSLMRGEEPNCYAAPDLGFAVLPFHMRKGYATEAATALLQWVENDRGVTAILGMFDPKNEASKGVFTKLGFKEEGERKLKVFGGMVGFVFTKGVDKLEDVGLESITT